LDGIATENGFLVVKMVKNAEFEKRMICSFERKKDLDPILISNILSEMQMHFVMSWKIDLVK
jgi:hypothetical protein